MSDYWWDKHLGKFRLYPHLVMIPIGGGIWECGDCKARGTLDELEGVGCPVSKDNPPCPWCGEAPLCAPDCVGIRMVLSDPKVYTIGNPYE